MIWQTTRFQIDLSAPRVMGIVNVTPDSFSDGGQHSSIRAAVRHCEQLVAEGADILDIGGESTRPGAPAVTLEEELVRVVPVIQEAVKLGVPVSIDTYKAGVMRAALDLGADIVNDIWALRSEGAMAVVSSHASCGICVMHMHRDPQTMQLQPMAGDPVAEVKDFLRQVTDALRSNGVSPERITIDPGIGFGKTVAQNFTLLRETASLLELGYPLLAGWSRKSSLAAATGLSLSAAAGLEMRDRVAPSIAAAVLAVERGAKIVRVHDVRETVAALGVWRAMNNSKT